MFYVDLYELKYYQRKIRWKFFYLFIYKSRCLVVTREVEIAIALNART
jgi:hypothetical protein